MLGIDHYNAFIFSAILLNITPGTDTIYILSKSVTGGIKKGIVSALGISTGILIHTVLAALGLSVILAKSALAFNTVKLVGAAYLILMGIKTLIQRGNLFDGDSVACVEKLTKIYRQGILTNALNPKVALFFLALLPQFVTTDNSYGMLPFLLLGLTFAITSTLWSLVLASISSFLYRFINKNERVSSISNKVAGMIYIALGIKVLSVKG